MVMPFVFDEEFYDGEADYVYVYSLPEVEKAGMSGDEEIWCQGDEEIWEDGLYAGGGMQTCGLVWPCTLPPRNDGSGVEAMRRFWTGLLCKGLLPPTPPPGDAHPAGATPPGPTNV